MWPLNNRQRVGVLVAFTRRDGVLPDELHDEVIELVNATLQRTEKFGELFEAVDPLIGLLAFSVILKHHDRFENVLVKDPAWNRWFSGTYELTLGMEQLRKEHELNELRRDHR